MVNMWPLMTVEVSDEPAENVCPFMTTLLDWMAMGILAMVSEFGATTVGADEGFVVAVPKAIR